MNDEQLLSQLTTLFEKQKKLADSAATRKGQKPTKKATRKELDLQFRSQVTPNVPAGGGFVRQTVIGYSYPPCITPLADLKPIKIGELRLETVHRGRVLVVRTFGHPLRVQAVQNAIEDGFGSVDRLSVYNFESGLQPAQVLPKGQIIAIKEPYYKETADGQPTVRVDHPSDILQLRPEDSLVPVELQPKLMELDDDSGEAWKAKGNVAYKKKDYRTAISMYTQGLKACSSSKADSLLPYDLYRNRAMANIHLRRYEAGLSDASAAVIPDNVSAGSREDYIKSNTKAFYRLGSAAYHLQDYDQAKEMFQSVLRLAPGDADAERGLRDAIERTRERSTGDYDFESMTKYAISTNKRIDAACFTANVVVRQSGDRGRGLFAANDINAGDLVLVEKAFYVAFNTDEGGDQSVIMNMNTSVMSVGTHPTRLVGAAHKIMYSPTLAEKFMQLYDGGYTPRGVKVVDGIVAVDTFQVEAALDYNGFGCPSTPTTQATEDPDVLTSSTGVWLVPSFINHDCIGNATRSFIGDMMIIRATKYIEEGQEILMRYKNAEHDNKKFQEDLLGTWKFKCGCPLCTAEAKAHESQRKSRLALITEATAFLETNKINERGTPSMALVTKAEQLRAKLDIAYDKVHFKDLPRQGMHELSAWICMAYNMHGSPAKVQKAALLTLGDLGYRVVVKQGKMTIDRKNCRMDITGIWAAMLLGGAYYMQGQSGLREQAENFAREMYETTHGCLVGFEEMFGSPDE